MPKVYARFPKTGLGNLMLIWARGLVFARINNFSFVSSLWYGFRLGPFLRNETKKRFYWRYFNETPYWKLMFTRFYSLFAKKIYNPPIDVVKSTGPFAADLYVYNQPAINNDLFEYIRDHHNLIKEELNKLIRPSLRKQLMQYPVPVISVHIRRGDFKLGSPITPLSYFINAIQLIRKTIGVVWPVTIFTDARKQEIIEIFDLPEIYLAEKKPDILDILLMSKSKVMVLSKSSTFSYWGAFLSNSVIIRSPGDWQIKIKSANKNEKYTEVEWDDQNKDTDLLLISALEKNYLHETKKVSKF